MLHFEIILGLCTGTKRVPSYKGELGLPSLLGSCEAQLEKGTGSAR